MTFSATLGKVKRSFITKLNAQPEGVYNIELIWLRSFCLIAFFEFPFFMFIYKVTCCYGPGEREPVFTRLSVLLFRMSGIKLALFVSVCRMHLKSLYAIVCVRVRSLVWECVRWLYVFVRTRTSDRYLPRILVYIPVCRGVSLDIGSRSPRNMSILLRATLGKGSRGF